MSRTNIVFTDSIIKRLKSRDKEYRRSEGNGFTIRVMPSGFKSWLYLYAIFGKRRCMNLGQYPEVSLATARSKFEAAKQQIKNGIDPLKIADLVKEDHRTAVTVKELFDDYMVRHAKLNKRESSWREDERLFHKNVSPQWDALKAADIAKIDCINLLDKYTDRPALCHNVMKLTRKLFNFAVEKDILERSPFTGVKVPVDLSSRDRILSDQEIKKLWNTELPKAAMCDEMKRIIKLLLLTGQRVGEVCGIHVDEIDGNWWTLPPERTKNGMTHRVYLSETALELLGTPLYGYYFPSPVSREDSLGNRIYTHITRNAVSYAIRKNLKHYQPIRPIKGEKIAMVYIPEEKKMDIAHFTPHDLRRTFSTGLASLGYHDEVIDAATGHKKQGIIRIYNRHKYDAEKQNAMMAWEKKLSILTKGKKL